MAVESPKFARVGEGITWTLDITDYMPTGWTGEVTPGTVTATNRVTGDDATVDVLTGSASAVGNVITLPKFSSASVGQFRLIVEFSAGAYDPARPAVDVHVIE
jgi:hypothetical protein